MCSEDLPRETLHRLPYYLKPLITGQHFAFELELELEPFLFFFLFSKACRNVHDFFQKQQIYKLAARHSVPRCELVYLLFFIR